MMCSCVYQWAQLLCRVFSYSHTAYFLIFHQYHLTSNRYKNCVPPPPRAIYKGTYSWKPSSLLAINSNTIYSLFCHPSLCPFTLCVFFFGHDLDYRDRRRRWIENEETHNHIPDTTATRRYYFIFNIARHWELTSPLSLTLPLSNTHNSTNSASYNDYIWRVLYSVGIYGTTINRYKFGWCMYVCVCVWNRCA